MTIFDKDDDFGIDDFAFALGFGEMVADEERTRHRPNEDPEPLVPDENEPEWWEKE